MYLLTPKFWYGAEPWALARMLWASRGRLDALRFPALVLGTYLSVVHAGLATASHAVFARRIAATRFTHPPIFILGHWRSGTTWLHELMSCDPRFAAPNGYQCFLPGHFLLSEPFLKPILQLVLPKTRPMDAMTLDLQLPQEDEFALLNRLGISPYLDFFNTDGIKMSSVKSLVIADLSERDQKAWISAWTWFLKSVLQKTGTDRQLLLKSPHHTARLETMLTVFPDARFVHIARDPKRIFASTERTWRSMIDEHGLTASSQRIQAITATVAANFDIMYESYRRNVGRVPASNLVEINYESLVSDPLFILEHVYDALDLGGFDRVRPKIETQLASVGDYQPHRYDDQGDPPSMAMTREVDWYRTRFGYADTCL